MDKLQELELLILDQATDTPIHGIVNDMLWLRLEMSVSNAGDRVRNALVRVSPALISLGGGWTLLGQSMYEI